MLAINLEAPWMDLAADAEKIRDAFQQISSLTQGSRLSVTGKAGVALGLALSKELVNEFDA